MAILKRLKKAAKKAVKKIKPKKSVKKIAKKSPPKKSRKTSVSKVKKVAKKVPSKPLKAIGKVTHFYGDIKVAIVRFSLPPRLGTEVLFKGATTDFKQVLKSVQYDHKAVSKIPKGKMVGIKVRSRVREGDKVYPVNK